jgi:hypothetical protein
MALFNKPNASAASTNPNDFVGSLQLARVETPKLVESTSGKFVNYGADNQYPQYLVNLTRTSALHRTLIENKAKLVAGSDITVNGTPIKEWVDSQSPITRERLTSLFFNPKWPLRDWIKRTAKDFEIFGAYSSETIWNSEFEFVKILKHIDTSKIRSGVMNSNGEVEKYYFSRDWAQWKPSSITPLAVFDKENKDNYNQIVYKKEYNPDLDYYTEPSYVGGLTYINLDSELGLFNLSHIKNGLNPGLIFKVPFQFKSAEEKQAFMMEFMGHFKGAANNKNPLILAKNGENTWDIDKVDVPNFDAQLIALGDFILQELIFAHRITSGELVGLLVPGKLGGGSAEELEFSMRQFMRFVIEPARLMLEETLEDVISTHGITATVKIVD